jgi:hypothetical protein
MHLLKMKLASLLRDNLGLHLKTYQADNHKLLDARYKIHRKNFTTLKKNFTRFEGEWLKLAHFYTHLKFNPCRIQ